ncbi:MAG: carbohydrate kinase family protein [Gemmatimonadota bacterium]
MEDWGGICYALSAFEAAGPPGWELFPVVKVGRDVREEASELFAGLDRIGATDGVRWVDEPNNRVELEYHGPERRTERLSGGVPGWSWGELAPLASSCDALYVNFIAGWELDLEVARELRSAVEGPVYADLHSLFLGVEPDGTRVPRELEDGTEWVSCFDLVQMNEDELRRLVGDGREDAGDPWRAAGRLTAATGTRALFVTRGARGARWIPRDPDLSGLLPAGGEAGGGTAGSDARFGEEPAPAVDDPDPTGCGDVWGITCFGALLAGSGVRDAVRRANRVAARNARHRGGRALARPNEGGGTRES